MECILAAVVIGWALLWNLFQVPKVILARFGIGCRSTFEINGRTVRRPERFRSGAHKRAFAAAGERITDAINHNFMENMTDEFIRNDTGWMYGKARMAPLEVWREVLSWYAAEECIFPRWQLGFPRYGQPFYVPDWGPDGAFTRFRVWEAKDVPDPSVFCPNLVTDQQREALIGTNYPTSSNSGEPGAVVLTEDNFRRVYFRPRHVISKADLRKAGNAMARGVAVAAARR